MLIQKTFEVHCSREVLKKLIELKQKSSAFIFQPSSMFENTEVTSMKMVIMLLELCI